MKVAEFYAYGGTVLKAIKRYCLDCSGGCKSEVRDCRHVACDLHPFREGKNPNRKMSPEQAKLAAERLTAAKSTTAPEILKWQLFANYWKTRSEREWNAIPAAKRPHFGRGVGGRQAFAASRLPRLE